VSKIGGSLEDDLTVGATPRRTRTTPMTSRPEFGSHRFLAGGRGLAKGIPSRTTFRTPNVFGLVLLGWPQTGNGTMSSPGPLEEGM
jgi:hypothetical protein